jgi:hypothetical protein
MEPAAMLAQLAADGRALRDAATNLEAPVPPCPGWTVKDAVEHTAMVYAHKSKVLETGAFEEGEWPPLETVVHRADVESRVGPPARVADEVAIDGIDELIDCFLSFDTWAYPKDLGKGQRISVRAGDAGWTVTLTPETATFSRSATDDADAAISGAPSDILLALWNRLPYDDVRTDGDPGALAALRTALSACTQ